MLWMDIHVSLGRSGLQKLPNFAVGACAIISGFFDDDAPRFRCGNEGLLNQEARGTHYAFG